MASEVRVRIVSAVLLTLAILSQLEIGAGPEKGPCLSASQEQEAKSWSAYASGLYSMTKASGISGGLESIHHALLLNPGDTSLRQRWLAFFLDALKDDKRVCERYREIYDSAPGDADNALCYALLLCKVGQKDDALKALTSSLDMLQWRDGILLCLYAVLDERHHHAHILELIEDADVSDACTNRWALDVCRAVYWNDDWVMKVQHLNARLHELGWFSKWLLKRRIAHARKKALEASLSALSDMSWSQDFVYATLYSVFKGMGEWERQTVLLRRVDDSFIRRKCDWWVQRHLELYRHLKNPQLLYEGLSRHDICHAVPVKTLREVIGIYMGSPELYEEALRLQASIVEISNGAFPEVMQLARMLAMADEHATALRLVEPLNADKMVLHDRLFRNLLLVRTGNSQRAYEDFVQIEFANRLKLRYPRLDAQFYYQYSMVCIKLKKIDRALELAKKGYHLAPEDPVFCNFYGYILADYNRELELAEALVRKALKAEPQNIAYLDSLGWVYFRKGEYRKALAQMTRVLDAGGLDVDEDGEIASHMHQIFLKLGMAGTAGIYQQPAAAAP